MAKFPRAPDARTLASRVDPDVRLLQAGTQLRVVFFHDGAHGRGWNQFRHYGPLASARFDHHQPPPQVQERGIFYCAPSTTTCVAEVFQGTRVINLNRRSPRLAIFQLARSIEVLDLCGKWPTRAGASQGINSGPRDRARGWSTAIYDAWPTVEGLWYRSSMHGAAPALALFERAKDALPAIPVFDHPLNHPDLFGVVRRIGADLGYRVL